MKSKFHLLFLIAFLVALFAISTSLSDGSIGQCGENLYYEYTLETGTLRIFGTGEMDSYQEYNSSPFSYKIGDINQLIIEEGVESIGAHAFGSSLFSACKRTFKCPTVIIPSSCKKVGNYAFAFLPNLKTVIIRDGVISIGDFAFGCDVFDYSDWHPERVIYLPKSVTEFPFGSGLFNASAVYYEGTIEDWKRIFPYYNPRYSSDTIYFSQSAPVHHSVYDFFGTWVSDHYYSYKTNKCTKISGDEATIVLREDGKIIINGEEGNWSLVNEEIVVDGEYSWLGMNNDDKLFMHVNKEFDMVFRRDDAESYTKIRLPSDMPTVEEYAFSNTNADVYIVPNGVQELKAGSLGNLPNAKYINLPSTLSVISEFAFSGTDNAVFICPSKSCPAYSWLMEHNKTVIIEMP